MSEPNEPQKCGKPFCKKPLPSNHPYKACEPCREKDAQYTRASRAKKKANAAETAENVNNKRKSAHRDGPTAAKRHKGTMEDSGLGAERSDTENDDDEPKDSTKVYGSPGEFYSVLRKQFQHQHVTFKGAYHMDVDPDITPRQRIGMVAQEIWKISSFRFTVKEHIKLTTGCKTRFWCSQDEEHTKKPKPSTRPGAKRRETVGMKRYPCQSRLRITCRYETSYKKMRIEVSVQHSFKHVEYLDVAMPPEALDMVRQEMEWLKPATMVSKIQNQHPNITATQIHRAWATLSQVYWRRDDDQLRSAKILLEEFPHDVDMFQLQDVPDGVEILAWGMKKVAGKLKRVYEIGIDATYNTNARHLELYSIMAEYDNTGFPLSYCLLTTASAIDLHKRRDSLAAWARCLRDKYGIKPTFTHVDKDMGEIGCIQDVWENAKISLCIWHLLRAVRTRLAKAKLATTPYNPHKAREEFAFVDLDFVPRSKQTDAADYEGGAPGESPPTAPNPNKPSDREQTPPLTIMLPPQTQAVHGPAKLVIKIPPSTQAAQPTDDQDPGDEEKERDRRTFCPAEYRPELLTMIERHYCAHSLIPGMSRPTPNSIRRWAVQDMYSFCVKYDLPEVWAYMWQNWYRKGRWELWARSAHEEIAVLKTTMMLEGHWRRVKHDFLHKFHLPRCDLLAWILVTKLAPSYYRKLDRLLTDNGRYRDLASWRKDFKKQWRALETREVSLATEDRYRPDVHKWICTCPSFVISRFLVCKHLVKLVNRVPAVFFKEAKRARSTPFWKHPKLVPKIEQNGGTNGEDSSAGEIEDDDIERIEQDGEQDEEEDSDDEIDMAPLGSTFEEEMQGQINTIADFAEGLRYQVQFRDYRMLKALKREGASFLRLAEACLTKEKRMRSSRGANVTTWDQSTSSAMFFRSRPNGAVDGNIPPVIV